MGDWGRRVGHFSRGTLMTQSTEVEHGRHVWVVINESAAPEAVWRVLGDKWRKWEYQNLRRKPQPEPINAPLETKSFPKINSNGMCEVDVESLGAWKGYHKNLNRRGCCEVRMSCLLCQVQTRVGAQHILSAWKSERTGVILKIIKHREGAIGHL